MNHQESFYGTSYNTGAHLNSPVSSGKVQEADTAVRGCRRKSLPPFFIGGKLLPDFCNLDLNAFYLFRRHELYLRDYRLRKCVKKLRSSVG